MPWNRDSQNILALVGGFLDPSWFGQLFKENNTAQTSKSPFPNPHIDSLGNQMVDLPRLAFTRNFPGQPFSPFTQSALLMWAKLTCTPTSDRAAIFLHLPKAAVTIRCVQITKSLFCVFLGIYTNTLSGFPKPINMLSQRSHFTAQCEGTRPSAFRFQPFSLIFHFVLWDGIRPGFPQVPGFHSATCQFFHHGPHV